MRETGIWERIGALMQAGGIEPTPANYDFWYRYVTGADPDLVSAVEALQRQAGRVGPREMNAIRRELYGDIGEPELWDFLARAQAQMRRIVKAVEGADADARRFSMRLFDLYAASERREREDRSGGLPSLEEVLTATEAMIEKSNALERLLDISGTQIMELKRDMKRLRSESRIDVLTGLANRKAFENYLEAQAARAVADRRPLTLAFCDIDNFKVFNDTWGHRTGDEVLRMVGENLEKLCHGIGLPARYGGEEFVIVLPGKDLDAAHDICEQVRDFIGTQRLNVQEHGERVGPVTLSVGIAELNSSDSLENLQMRADAALYLAKQKGRDRTCLESELRSKAA